MHTWCGSAAIYTALGPGYCRFQSRMVRNFLMVMMMMTTTTTTTMMTMMTTTMMMMLVVVV